MEQSYYDELKRQLWERVALAYVRSRDPEHSDMTMAPQWADYIVQAWQKRFPPPEKKE